VDKIQWCESVRDCVHANDNLDVFQDFEEKNGGPHNTRIKITRAGSDLDVPCVIGTSRRGWQRRDLNMVMAKAHEAESAETEISFLQKLGPSTLPISPREFSENTLYHFQEQKDEMTDEKLRIWMMLAYARPCKALSAEDNVCVTQENFSRNAREKGDCEDVEMHYQEDVRENRGDLSCKNSPQLCAG
jgi:hypothetical protein